MTSISDTNVVNAPGGLVELGYKEVTSPVTVTGTQGSQTTIVSPMSIVCDGSPVFIEFFSPYTQYGSTAGNWCVFSLWVDGVLESHISENFYFANSLGNFDGGPGVGFRRLTPSAGVHTFEIRAWRNNANVTVGTGSGYSPIYLRVSKVIQASQLIVQTPNAPLVTSLPSNAIDGQEVRYLVDNTNGIVWNFRYRAGSSSAYKWEFIGGSQLSSTVSTFQQLAAGSGVWSDLATVGPAVTIPLAGDYSIHANAQMYNNFAGAARGFYGISLNGAAPFVYVGEDIAAQGHYAGGGINYTSSGLSAGASLKQLYQQINVGVQFGYRYIGITPIRVSA